MSVTCPICGKSFVRQTVVHRYCSNACASKAARMGVAKRIAEETFEPREFTCRCCGEYVSVTEPSDKRTVYCSAACERKYWRDVTRHKSRRNDRITNYHSAGDYFSYERRSNERWAGA